MSRVKARIEELVEEELTNFLNEDDSFTVDFSDPKERTKAVLYFNQTKKEGKIDIEQSDGEGVTVTISSLEQIQKLVAGLQKLAKFVK
jgi:hypothetical protein